MGTALEIVVGVKGGVERTYVLRAANVQERNRWLEALDRWTTAEQDALKKFSMESRKEPLPRG